MSDKVGEVTNILHSVDGLQLNRAEAHAVRSPERLLGLAPPGSDKLGEEIKILYSASGTQSSRAEAQGVRSPERPLGLVSPESGNLGEVISGGIEMLGDLPASTPEKIN